MAYLRTLFVGDIHGCALEFADLLTHTKFSPATDRLVLVGDLVARGPDSRAVVDLARANGAMAVRGNHDEKVLSWWRASIRHDPETADRMVKLSDRHRAVVKQLDDSHFRWLDALPLMLAFPEHNVLVVHAGVDPSRPPIESDEDILLTVRSIDNRGAPTRKLTGTPWARQWRGPTQIIFGHDARRNLQLEAFATGLDTGCCYGRQLTGLVLDRDEILPASIDARRGHLVSVTARNVWCPTGTGDGPE